MNLENITLSESKSYYTKEPRLYESNSMKLYDRLNDLLLETRTGAATRDGGWLGDMWKPCDMMEIISDHVFFMVRLSYLAASLKRQEYSEYLEYIKYPVDPC